MVSRASCRSQGLPIKYLYLIVWIVFSPHDCCAFLLTSCMLPLTISCLHTPVPNPSTTHESFPNRFKAIHSICSMQKKSYQIFPLLPPDATNVSCTDGIQLSLKENNTSIESLLEPFALSKEYLRPFHQALLTDILPIPTSDSSPVLLAATDYFQHSRRGKGFRPTIVTLLAKALEQVPDSHPDVWNKQGILSQIIEMIHVASLMHDDIIDDAHTRRGGPAAHRKFSPKVAVLAGDFLLARASLFLGRLDNTEVVQVMAQALEALVSGEIMQQTKSPESLLAMESYIIKSYHKTASLIAHACRSTALLAGHESNSTVTQQCDEIGFHMGLAYQIQDDILDLTQSSKDLGKPALVDMSLGLGTAPILYAAQEDSSLAPLIARRFREPGDVQAAWEALQRRPTAMYKARVLACFHAQKAVDALYKLPPSDERDALIRLTHMIIDRKK